MLTSDNLAAECTMNTMFLLFVFFKSITLIEAAVHSHYADHKAYMQF